MYGEFSFKIYQSCLAAFLTFASKSCGAPPMQPTNHLAHAGYIYDCGIAQEQQEWEQQEHETVKTKKAPPFRKGPN